MPVASENKLQNPSDISFLFGKAPNYRKVLKAFVSFMVIVSQISMIKKRMK